MGIVEIASLYLLGLYNNQKGKAIEEKSVDSDSSSCYKYPATQATSFDPSSSSSSARSKKMDKVMRMSTERGVVIFSKSSCCLSYAVQVLFQDLGVTPKIHEIDKDPECREIEKALMRLGCSKPVPAVFIGGKLVGSTNEVMSMHLSSSLVPLVKPYLC